MNVNETGNLCELAALYSLNLLEGEEELSFAAHLSSCPKCMPEVKELTETAALIAVTEARRPPAHLRERVVHNAISQQGGVLVRREEGAWEDTPFPGVKTKRLFFDRTTGNMTVLVKVGPGAEYPRHVHAGFEHLYVLEGELSFEDHTLRAGDFEVMGAESRHSHAVSKEGCTVLITHNVRDEILA